MNDARTDFIWNGQNLVASASGDTANYYTYDGTGIHSANINGTVYNYLKDEHGNVTGLTDSTGTKHTESYEYDAFGNQQSENANTINPFRYCGEYFDEETGLIYLRNRYYDTAMGRFINEDPVRSGLNWYIYCKNNPLMFVDPSGKEEQRDREVLDAFDYRRIQILTDIYNDAIENNDIFTADHAHAFATRIRQSQKYRGIEGYGPTYVDVPKDIYKRTYILPIKGYKDNYDYSVEINVYSLTISNPYSAAEAEIYSGRAFDTLSNSQALSVADGTQYEGFANAASIALDITSLFFDRTLLGALTEGDIKATISKGGGNGIEYYFHRNSAKFYYKKVV